MKQALFYCGIFIFLNLNIKSSYSEIVFVDISGMAGVSGDIYFSAGGHGLGVNWVDINNDGWDDLFVVGGKPDIPPKLFLNNKNGTFTPSHHLLPKLPAVEMSGSRFADFDRDGDKDLFIYTDNLRFRLFTTNDPDGPANILLKNNFIETGEISFINIAQQSGLDDLAPVPLGDLPSYRSKTASWMDYNRDGCIDLFVGHLVINSSGENSNKDRLFHNNCDGTFTDKTSESGINPGNNKQSYRAALVSGGFQLTNDLWPDLYVVNVSGIQPQPLLNDFLYINQSKDNLENQFIESINQSFGVGDDAQAGMGIDTADINHDGNWDIYISDLFDTDLDELPLGNVLYMGNEKGGFSDNSAPETGVQSRASWGVNFFDADNDTWEDLFVATIFMKDPDFLYRNNGTDDKGNVTFSEVLLSAGIVTENARGSATADFDHDGDLDIAVVNQSGSLQLFRNDTANSGNWIVLKLKSTISNLDAIGTVIRLKSGEVYQTRQVKGGSSAHSQDSLNVHFGLANINVIDQINVHWPSGKETVIKNLEINQYYEIVEPRSDLIFYFGFESIE
ncbi:MAG: CRTAC1 family protein [Marinicellaceae bacterium]